MHIHLFMYTCMKLRLRPLPANMYIYIYTYIHAHIAIYISLCIYIYSLCIHVCNFFRGRCQVTIPKKSANNYIDPTNKSIEVLKSLLNSLSKRFFCGRILIDLTTQSKNLCCHFTKFSFYKMTVQSFYRILKSQLTTKVVIYNDCTADL